MKNVVIIQTRMGSTRLPGKVLYPLMGRTVLEHVVNRVKSAKMVDSIVIATTENSKDNIIVEWAKTLGVECFCGSESDVLSRYYDSAKKYQAGLVIRITSDCPLIDSKLIDDMIRFYNNNEYVMVTNSGPYDEKRTYPRGLDVEIFTFEMLENAYYNANEEYEKEHVTPFLYKHYKNNIYHYINQVDLSNYRWTLDTYEDFKMIKLVYKHLFSENSVFFMDDVIELLDNYPEIGKVNEDIIQKKIIY